MGLMFFCLGVGIHSRLLYRSRDIPRAISGLHPFCCTELLLCCFLFILFPDSSPVPAPASVMLDLCGELVAALWLALKAVKLPAPKEKPSPLTASST